MKQFVYDEASRLYRASGVDFGTNSQSIRLTFAGNASVCIATVRVDGKAIGVVPLSGRNARVADAMGAFSDHPATGEGDPGAVPADRVITEARGEIDPTSGVHDVTVELRCGNAELIAVEASAENAYEGIHYTPVSPRTLRPLNAATWEATDMLGRRIASTEDVRGAHKDRKVGLFFWTWHEAHAHMRPVDVVDTLDKYPAAEYSKDHPAWGERPFQCFWHEPLYGYYRDSDPYIIRHHAALLSAAGVDFLAFDCTNGSLIWRDAYEPLLKGLYEARQDGIPTPQIAFIMNFAPFETTESMLRALYQNLYKPGLYEDLWYRVDGKPLVMAYPEAVEKEGVCPSDTRLLKEIREFFTFRPGQPLYKGGATRPDQWGWLEMYPQNKYGIRPDGTCEQVTVGVGQNANPEHICTHFNNKDTFGRSYTGKDGFKHLDAESYKYGYNVQEQWDRAIDLDPDSIFVTGWNEWIMGQFHEPWLDDDDSTQLAMVDQYDREHSRDIEMDRDGYLDTYYLQLAHNIRRYKGSPAREPISPAGIVNLQSGEKDWKAVTPVYRNPKGTTIHRDWAGFGDCHYVNDTGRNDIVEAQVSRDEENLYFRVKCADRLTPREGEGWMTLYLDMDRSKATGWEGYDFVINRLPGKQNRASVERYAPTAEKGSFTWASIGEAAFRVSGNTLTVAIPRALLGAEAALNFEFKWSDHMQKPDVMDFYQNGCAAPIGRFNYLYRE